MPDTPSGGDKQVKLSFVIDQASLQSARTAIGGLIADTQKLAETMKSVGGGLGAGILGGGNVGGTQNAQQVLAGTSAGGANANSAKALQENSRALQSLSQSTQEAMRSMTDALKRSLSEQERAVDNLQRKVNTLTQAFGQLGSASVGGAQAASGALGGGAVPGLIGGGASVAAAGLGLVDQYGRPISSGAAPAATAASGAPPVSNGAQAAANVAGGGGAGGAAGGGNAPTPPPGAMDQLAAQFKKAMGPLAIANMIGTGAVGAVKEYSVDQYMRYGREAAARSDVWSPYMRRAMGGDASLGMLTDAVARDKDFQALSHQIAGVKIGAGADALGGGSITGFGRALLSPFQSTKALMQGIGDTQANTKLMQLQSEFMQNKEKEMAVDMAYANRFQQNMGGKFSWMHQTGQDYKYDPNTGLAIKDRIGTLQTRLQGTGFTEGEYMGAFSGVQGVAGRHAANALAMQSMYGVASGIGNAGQLAGLSAITGGGKGDFMQYLYGAQGGKGGYDPGALASIGQAIAGEAMKTGVMSSGVGTLNAMFAGMGPGTNGALDMFTARNVGAGLSALTNVTTGGIDRYQSGQNVLNASRSLGAGANMYSIDYLANKMTSQQMLDILGGGAIDPHLAAMGITKESVQKQFAATGESMMNRYNATGNSKVDDVMRAFQASGMSMKDFYKQSKDKAGTRTAFETALANTEGIDFGAASAELGAMLGAGAKGGRRGGPRGVAGTKSPEAKLAEELAEAEQKNVDKTLEVGKKLDAVNKDFAAMSGRYQNLTENLSTSAEGAAQALRDLEAAAASLAVAQGGMSARAAVDKFKNQYKGHKSELLAKAKSASGMERAEMVTAANELGVGGDDTPEMASNRQKFTDARKALGHRD